MKKYYHNPDILTCMANLSSDEVFTPPKIANKMLDTLPDEIWQNDKITFLDPFSKTGVFLREITERLLDGLKPKIPNLKNRIEHVLTKQVFGISTSSLTSLMTKRTLYFSKNANSAKSITDFSNNDGNIKHFKNNHIWTNKDLCKFCGVNKKLYDRNIKLEQYAYSFIHTDKPHDFFKMKFDVIVGNPPYQMKDGGGTGDSAKPIYHHFVKQAMKLQPTFLSMIIQSRWMKGGKGLDKFRDEIMHDTRIKHIYDFENAKECFENENIDGGVCYFLWDKNYKGKVDYYYKPKNGKEIFSKRYLKSEYSSTVIRDHRQLSILQKVFEKKETKMDTIVSARKPYGISTDLFNDPKKYNYTKIPEKPFKDSVKVFGVKGNKGGAKRIIGYIRKNQCEDHVSIKAFKLFHSYAYTTTATTPPKIIIGKPDEICTETFLKIGDFKNKVIAENCLSYIKTKFFRALLAFNRIQKNLSQRTFNLIPIQDFNKAWTDSELIKKYKLDNKEIQFIDSFVEPMK
jgi:site-specific DNA-methyltransferase (adenine-specific)